MRDVAASFMKTSNLSKKVTSASDDKLTPLEIGLERCRSAFHIVFGFSFVINMCMLITPIYSLQVLDRVVGSGNIFTLFMLFIVIASIYLSYSLLQIARTFLQVKIGEWLDRYLSPILFGYNIALSAMRQSGGSSQILRDFQQIKTFITGTSLTTILDAPWSIAYIAVIFMIHPYIGWLSIGAAILVILFALLNAVVTNKTISEANDFSVKGMSNAEVASRNAEVVEAMGMIKNVTENWQKFNDASLQKQSDASYKNAIISNISRFIRNLVQMLVTGIGAYVVVRSNGAEMTTGGMIASSIIVGRALAPLDHAIEMWKSISGAMKSYKNIQSSFDMHSLRDKAMPIPDIEGRLSVDNLYYTHPISQKSSQSQAQASQAPQAIHPKYILSGVSFALEPGELLAIIGPSGSGKSTLAKVIVGVWKASSGRVQLDGGEIYRWNREDFGKYVGYLPQGIELFSGSIKQNIARMEDDPDLEDVISAAKMAGAHDLILNLQEGYDTDIGVSGSNLSAGQRQRIGLARVFYKNPRVVILDEPNANLDEAGEIALASALEGARERKMAVIIISHRHSILRIVDKILMLQDGSIAAFGKKDEVMARVNEKAKSADISLRTKEIV